MGDEMKMKLLSMGDEIKTNMPVGIFCAFCLRQTAQNMQVGVDKRKGDTPPLACALGNACLNVPEVEA